MPGIVHLTQASQLCSTPSPVSRRTASAACASSDPAAAAAHSQPTADASSCAMWGVATPEAASAATMNAASAAWCLELLRLGAPVASPATALQCILVKCIPSWQHTCSIQQRNLQCVPQAARHTCSAARNKPKRCAELSTCQVGKVADPLSQGLWAATDLPRCLPEGSMTPDAGLGWDPSPAGGISDTLALGAQEQ